MNIIIKCRIIKLINAFSSACNVRCWVHRGERGKSLLFRNRIQTKFVKRDSHIGNEAMQSFFAFESDFDEATYETSSTEKFLHFKRNRHKTFFCYYTNKMAFRTITRINVHRKIRETMRLFYMLLHECPCDATLSSNNYSWNEILMVWTQFACNFPMILANNAALEWTIAGNIDRRFKFKFQMSNFEA